MYHPGNKYMLADDLQTHIMQSNMILALNLENDKRLNGIEVKDRNRNHKDI